tara:strand:+ start:279 stop:437 length:159 start_codon:yes stop_codon:yes gene_type:complete
LAFSIRPRKGRPKKERLKLETLSTKLILSRIENLDLTRTAKRNKTKGNAEEK